ncbi:Fanconi anaemia protein FancD2 nuclease-domain-containing protein, partial [Mycotypha africana]|uniref:Fanconi anemia protein FancD2 nuclease-domain-containing protein n=1 Tax=Mycotypha africana TaxID=64632 RepID=UPI0022FFEE4C
LQTYIEDPSVFRKFLLPSKLADTLIVYLLERLPEFYDELEHDSSSSCTSRLILHQLRWLDYIVQPELLTEKLMEASFQLTLCPIVVYLKELMSENTDLMVPVLDALSNLTIHSEGLEDVRETVLERLVSVELDALPVIVKFLLQTVTPQTVDWVVLEIRQKLDFKQLGKIQEQSTQSKEKAVKDTPEALILESIKTGLQFHRFVCDSWLKSIVALHSQREHKLIDMLVLIILCSMTSMKKKVENIIKKKIVQGKLTASLFEQTILYHSDGISGYWNTLLTLAESLLRSCQQNNSISSCAAALYLSLFQSADAYYRQEIIGALVTHIGSGIEAEINTALDVLLKLVQMNASNVIGYSVFIKGILEYLDNLNEHQIRTLFDIFSLLALTV